MPNKTAHALRLVHVVDAVLNHQPKGLANVSGAGKRQRSHSALGELESYTTNHRSARSRRKVPPRFVPPHGCENVGGR